MDELRQTIRKEFEDYFRDRHSSLIGSEKDSALVGILKEVSLNASPSDIIVVLEKYDTIAEKVIPEYWNKRLEELNVYLKSHGQSTLAPLDADSIRDVNSFLSANPSKNSSGFDEFLSPNLYAKRQVAFMERFFGGVGETITGIDMQYA